MKKFLTILFLIVVSVTTFAQNDQKISYVTPKKDTLYLVDASIGYQIKWVWDSVPRYDKEKPVIVMVPQARIDELCRFGTGCNTYSGAATIPSSGTIKRKRNIKN